MSGSRIVVVGSVNTDMVVKTETRQTTSDRRTLATVPNHDEPQFVANRDGRGERLYQSEMVLFRLEPAD